MANISKQYQELKEGKISKEFFTRSMRMQFPDFVSPTTSMDDAVRILKSKRIIVEANALGNTKSGFSYLNPSEPQRDPADYVEPMQLMRGTELELSKMPDLSNESYAKARAKAVKNLTKDKQYYKELQIKNHKEVKKYDETQQMTPVTTKSGKVNERDKKLSADGHVKKPLKKDEAANTKVTKKENRKGKPKGVKLMESTGKESVLSEIKAHLSKKKAELNEDQHFNYTMGERVKTPEGEGNIIGITGGTMEVKLDNGQFGNYQTNILDKLNNKINPNRQGLDPNYDDQKTRAANFSKMPNLGKYNMKSLAEIKEEKKKSIIKKLKEFFSKKKVKKEDIFQKGAGSSASTVVASSPNSVRALKNTGYKQIPGTQDAKGS